MKQWETSDNFHISSETVSNIETVSVRIYVVSIKEDKENIIRVGARGFGPLMFRTLVISYLFVYSSFCIQLVFRTLAHGDGNARIYVTPIYFILKYSLHQQYSL